MNKILIIPTGGLCNRMRAIASGVFLSQEHRLPAEIEWNIDNGLNACFEELFKPLPPSFASIKTNTRWLYSISGTKDYLLRWPLLRLCYQTIFNFSLQDKGEIRDHIKFNSKRDLLLISCFSMCQDYPFEKLFIPQDDIQSRIDSITSQFTPNTIGIHVRRTDNIESIRQSPIELFVEKMQEEVEQDPNVSFYLASDDNAVKEELNRIFPHRILTTSGNTLRDNVEGMKFAVLELYCLSKTQKIIGSHFSSYSHIAAQLGHIPIVYARK